MSESRPDVSDGDWVVWGGQLIGSMAESSGEGPDGRTFEVFREIMAEDDGEAPWVRAKRALRRAFARGGPDVRVEVGYVDSHGAGVSRHGFVAEVEVDPDPEGLADTYVALVAHGEADAEYVWRVQREARVLEWVSPRIRGIRVPQVVALVGDRGAPILVESFVPGLPVDLRMGKQPIEPWEVVAAAAGAIHRVEVPPAHVLAPRDRRQHRAELAQELFPGGDPGPGALGEAYAWMCEHIDRAGEGVLLHGDLLGQNLRLYPGRRDTGVIDWEYVRIGDPAYDLAIVTRGVRQPYRWPEGRARLLAAHARESGLEVTRADICFFELAMHVRWVLRPTPDIAEHQGRLTRLLHDAERI